MKNAQAKERGPNLMLSQEHRDGLAASNEGAGENGGQKGKNPYYFTFFNEKGGEGKEGAGANGPRDEEKHVHPDAANNDGLFSPNAYSTIDQDIKRRPTAADVLDDASGGDSRVGHAQTAQKGGKADNGAGALSVEPTPSFTS